MTVHRERGERTEGVEGKALHENPNPTLVPPGSTVNSYQDLYFAKLLTIVVALKRIISR